MDCATFELALVPIPDSHRWEHFIQSYTWVCLLITDFSFWTDSVGQSWESYTSYRDWLDGIWVGRVSKSDEHLVLTERGAIYSRTVRLHPRGEHVREIFEKVRGLPWNPSGRVEPIVRSDQPPPVQPPTSRQEYLREFGKTANCRACEGIRGPHHTKFCQDRFEAWQKDRGFSEVPTDQRDNVEEDPVPEPAMTGDLLDPEVAGSTLPPDRGRKRR